MQRGDIMSMKPGRELDELVMRHVLKENLFYGPDQYSTDIKAAWEIVEKMKASNERTIFELTMQKFAVKEGKNVKSGMFYKCKFGMVGYSIGREVVCDTASEAIVKAALMAIELVYAREG